MSTNFVKYGLWADYNRSPISRYQILLTDWWAGILTNALAVLITSAGRPLFTLTVGLYNWLWRKISSRWTNIQAASLQDARDTQESIGIILEPIRHGGFANVPLGGPPIGRTKEAIEIIGTGAMVLIVLGLPVMLITASIVSAGLATDTTALSNAYTCGKYEHRLPNSSDILLEYDHKAEVEANMYAIDCYGTSPLVENCNRFYSQNITYTVNSAGCPFKGNVCGESQNGSIRLSTGLTSGSVLGINAKNPYFFSRTMICSPLVTDEEYVGIGLSSRGEKQWEYWYGSSLSNYTWVNPVQKSPWEIKGYSTSIHWWDPIAPQSPFHPLDEFTAGPYPVTLNFISSHAIYYHNFRNDSVFPAQTKARFADGYPGPDLYYNNSTRAGVLGCVDQYQICESINGPCSAGSTQFTGSEALDAQSKLNHMLSMQLADEQWKVEAEKMFQTSLARMQINLFDFVRGTAAGYPGAYNTLPPEHRGMCAMVEIPTVGWRNVNLVGFLGTIAALGVVWGVSRKRKDASGEEILVVTIIYNSLVRIVVFIWRDIFRPVGVLFGKLFISIVLEPLRNFMLKSV
ncbi:uncharacterized protein LY89DRAFT_784443 [Mollisia scopiformis]|uniref:Uncharacterized protein n=1 Tax=Mollisia scopiformis TaxID=149040 RepID=A0A194X3W4_MOLSC|nr:uncharacterized protein LY89DRAFT_784443 [Mollisia scopiformis]KUJ14512.1 hypothetical protein LY89DRAFT_784443 [Mollisia scopiformis]